MAERSITIHVKDGINLAKMMAAIFREYEPSIDSISMIGVDTPVDHDIVADRKCGMRANGD